ncbi:MAG: DotU family type IV/VI secretion system protein, partial [Pseudohongiellaceae bacterium]
VELYFSCLQFGYQGSYKLKGFDQLQAYISTFRAQLDDQRGPVNRDLADQAVPERRLVYRIGGNQPYWVMAAVGGALMVALFLTYGGLMKTALSASADQLLQYQSGSQAVPGDRDDG